MSIHRSVCVVGLAAVLFSCSPAAVAPAPAPASESRVVNGALPAVSAVAPDLPLISERDPLPVAIAFVIDRSGSMTGDPLQLAKDATTEAIADLTPSDWVAIVAFDSKATSRVGHPGDAAINEFIDGITPAGGTDYYPALEMAFAALRPVPLSKKQIILLTDGRAPAVGLRDFATQIREAGIVLTTVGFGGDVDDALLAELAAVGAGHFHAVPQDGALADVFHEEVARLVAKQ